MRYKLKKNDGYTMVEMIIVIAIIAIMTGMGALTISSIRTSQANASMQRFDGELSTLLARAKSLDGVNAIRLVKNEGNYDIYYGSTDAIGNFTDEDGTNPKVDAVLQRVTIYYAKDYDSSSTGAAVSEQIIEIKRADREVLQGYGQYIFHKYNGSTVGRVTLNQVTGSHTFGSN